MSRVHVEHVFAHPIERVFERYTDHAGWTDWAGLGPVRLAQEGRPERNGVGAVRAFGRVRGLREEVFEFEPPSPAGARMVYRVVAGPVPMRDHRGEVTFSREGSGTRLAWTVTFRPALPGVGWIAERGLTVLFGRMLAALDQDLDRGAR
jgi:uncharacterized protein YndB with AHSA1/START domain